MTHSVPMVDRKVRFLNIDTAFCLPINIHKWSVVEVLYGQGKIRGCKYSMTNLERFLKRLDVAPGWISFLFLGSNGVLSVLQLLPHLHLQFGSLLTKVTLTPCSSWYVQYTLQSHRTERTVLASNVYTSYNTYYMKVHPSQFIRQTNASHCQSSNIFPTCFINKACVEKTKRCCRPCWRATESHALC